MGVMAHLGWQVLCLEHKLCAGQRMLVKDPVLAASKGGQPQKGRT